MTQTEALKILQTGANVFLTGEPGSGKTHTINQYVAYLRACGIEPAITASTGIAATHLGGLTIHSWAGIGIKRRLNQYDLDKIASTEYLAKRISRAKVLIIDEISMLSPATLEMVEAVCRAVKQDEAPFGGLQVILVGDFFQLPPIVKKVETEEGLPSLCLDEEPPLFAYDSSLWDRSQFVTCYLTEQHRQDDDRFLSILSAIRRNDFEAGHLADLSTRQISVAEIPSDITKLFSKNFNVDQVNDQMLGRVAGESRTFSMEEEGVPALVAILKKGCLSPELLRLKVGAVVMFTKNNLKDGYVNGTLGLVKNFNALTGQPIVRLKTGLEIEVSPVPWSVEENGKIRAQISQLPLRLAWAITVHKSQGMSLDEAVMDLSDVFEFGQGYVALSRVRRLSGLHLLGWNERAFQVHPEVLVADETFRDNSTAAGQAFGQLSAAELDKMADNFIKACGGKRAASAKGRGRSKAKQLKAGAGDSAYALKLAKLREKHPNAYRPWTDELDQALSAAFTKHPQIKDLTKRFGRQPGSIKARLMKLGLIDEDGEELLKI